MDKITAIITSLIASTIFLLLGRVWIKISKLATHIEKIPSLIKRIEALEKIPSLVKRIEALEKNQEPVEITGEWEYKAKTTDSFINCNSIKEIKEECYESAKSKGTCSIKISKEGKIEITGRRTKASFTKNGQPEMDDRDLTWYAIWAEICHDGKLRFEFLTTIPGGGDRRGYNNLTINEHFTKMAGDSYYMTPTPAHGKIEFTKK